MKLLQIFILLLVCQSAVAGSLYLPTKLSPEIETHIERVFVLAEVPIVKRPIPIKKLQKAVEKIQYDEPLLARRIRRYLERFSAAVAITHADIRATAISEDATFRGINDFGFAGNSRYRAAISAHWVVNGYIALNAGGLYSEQRGDEKNHTPEGSFVSIGNDYLQTDIGFRTHWWSPFQESSMLLSTQAASPLSITLSNIEPLSFLNTEYEVFIAQLSKTTGIQSEDDATVFEEGRPKLFGFHLGISPIRGFSLAVNRLLQFGGASRDESFEKLFNAFINAKKNDNVAMAGRDFGNQQSSITTRYTFSERFPISIYMEYAGEDASATSGLHLGNSALMFGLHLPKVFTNVDITYETAEWQNAWYTNGNYRDSGMRNFSSVLGHWGGNQRIFNMDDGARASTLKLAWDIASGSMITAKYRIIKNVQAKEKKYVTGEMLELQYSQAMLGLIGGLEFQFGNTVFDEKLTQLSGFVRW